MFFTLLWRIAIFFSRLEEIKSNFKMRSWVFPLHALHYNWTHLMQSNLLNLHSSSSTKTHLTDSIIKPFLSAFFFKKKHTDSNRDCSLFSIKRIRWYRPKWAEDKTQACGKRKPTEAHLKCSSWLSGGSNWKAWQIH